MNGFLAIAVAPHAWFARIGRCRSSIALLQGYPSSRLANRLVSTVTLVENRAQTRVPELPGRVVAPGEIPELGCTGVPGRELGAIDGEEFPPVRPRLEGRECLLDDWHERSHLVRMVAPGEAEADTLPPVRRAEPQLVGGAGPDLGGVQVRVDAIAKRTQLGQRRRSVRAIDEPFALQFIATRGGRRIQPEVRQPLGPRPGDAAADIQIVPFGQVGVVVPGAAVQRSGHRSGVLLVTQSHLAP